MDKIHLNKKKIENEKENIPTCVQSGHIRASHIRRIDHFECSSNTYILTQSIHQCPVLSNYFYHKTNFDIYTLLILSN